MLNPPNDQDLFAGYAGQLHRTPHEQMLGRVDPIWLYRAEGSATSTPRLGETMGETQRFDLQILDLLYPNSLEDTLW